MIQLHIATLCFATGLLPSGPLRLAVARIADPSDVYRQTQRTDGIFWMCWEDFQVHFQNIDVCHRSKGECAIIITVVIIIIIPLAVSHAKD